MKIINKVAIVTIVVNLVLAVGKFLAGIFGHSTAMISDAVHSSSDVLSTLIVLVGARIAVKNEDKDHNYGHDKFESIASILLAMLLFATALALGWTGIKSIADAAKGGEFVKPTLAALSSVAGFVGILGAMLGVYVLEGIATVLIALLIIKVSYDIVKIVLRQLTDHAAPEELVGKIYKTINDDEDVKNVDLLKTRISGSIIYVEAEIAVDRELSIVEAHDIAQRVHDKIETTFEEVRHIVIHVNPY